MSLDKTSESQAITCGEWASLIWTQIGKNIERDILKAAEEIENGDIGADSEAY